MSDHAELLAYLEQPALARLWAAARTKVETLGRVGGAVRLDAATREEREAVAGLLGLPKLPPENLSARLDRVDAALSGSRFAIDLPTALTRLGGPLRDLPAERRRRREHRRQLHDDARRHELLRREPGLAGWLDGIESSGLLLRLTSIETASDLLSSALAVLEKLLPRTEEPTVHRLAVLANQVLGRSHGLDPGEPAATLVLGALAHLRGASAPRTSAERRETWEWAGVVADDLSCDVLTLGLRPAAAGAVGTALRALAEAGEPARITLRQLAALELASWPARAVRVCENPMVLALAADRLGPECPPLVCLAGVPNQAGRVLLHALAQAGAELSYHGDFDWPGLRIANGLWRELPLRSWRFTTQDYERALLRSTEGAPLIGEPVPATWDEHLSTAMASSGVAVEEEAVVEELVADLAG